MLPAAAAGAALPVLGDSCPICDGSAAADAAAAAVHRHAPAAGAGAGAGAAARVRKSGVMQHAQRWCPAHEGCHAARVCCCCGRLPRPW